MLFDFSDTINGKNMSNKLIHANFFFLFFLHQQLFYSKHYSLIIKIDQGSKENIQNVK